MPQVPMLPPDQMAQAQAGVSPAHFLMAAAEMSKNGQLADQQQSSVVPKGKPLQTGHTRRSTRPLRMVK